MILYDKYVIKEFNIFRYQFKKKNLFEYYSKNFLYSSQKYFFMKLKETKKKNNNNVRKQKEIHWKEISFKNIKDILSS